MTLAALALAAAAPADAVVARHGFAGEILTVRGARVDDRAYGRTPAGAAERPGARRPLPGVARQLLAVLAEREAAAGRLAPDAATVPGGPTLRAQLADPAVPEARLLAAIARALRAEPAAALRRLPGDAAPAKDGSVDGTAFGLLAFDTGLARRPTGAGARDGEATLPGCPAPVRVIEGGGEGPDGQARNWVLPAAGAIVVLLTDRSAAAMPLGDAAGGLAQELLAAVACPAAKAPA